MRALIAASGHPAKQRGREISHDGYPPHDCRIADAWSPMVGFCESQ
jgi:hypothetical protein